MLLYTVPAAEHLEQYLVTPVNWASVKMPVYLAA